MAATGTGATTILIPVIILTTITEAATTAIAAIIEEETVTMVGPHVSQALPLLIMQASPAAVINPISAGEHIRAVEVTAAVHTTKAAKLGRRLTKAQLLHPCLDTFS